MTGFADLAGDAGGLAWVWEARSVNGRGLDLRLRLPEGFDSLDAPPRSTPPSPPPSPRRRPPRGAASTSRR